MCHDGILEALMAKFSELQGFILGGSGASDI